MAIAYHGASLLARRLSNSVACAAVATSCHDVATYALRRRPGRHSVMGGLTRVSQRTTSAMPLSAVPAWSTRNASVLHVRALETAARGMRSARSAHTCSLTSGTCRCFNNGKKPYDQLRTRREVGWSVGCKSMPTRRCASVEAQEYDCPTWRLAALRSTHFAAVLTLITQHEWSRGVSTCAPLQRSLCRGPPCRSSAAD